jgi:hypothetical protein
VFIPSFTQRKSHFIEFVQFMLPSPDVVDTSKSCTTREEASMGIEGGYRYFSQEFKKDAAKLMMEKRASVRKSGYDIGSHPNLVHY